MATMITAEDLQGVHSQQEAGTVLQRILKDTKRGDAKLADGATTAIEHRCAGLARVIQRGVDDWNHQRENALFS